VIHQKKDGGRDVSVLSGHKANSMVYAIARRISSKQIASVKSMMQGFAQRQS